MSGEEIKIPLSLTSKIVMACASLIGLAFALYMGIDFVPEALAKHRIPSPLFIIGIQVYVEQHSQPLLYWAYLGFLVIADMIGLIAIVLVWRDIVTGKSTVLRRLDKPF